jgi:hypothetical protein
LRLGGEAEGLHFVGVLSFGDEFREDVVEEKFGSVTSRAACNASCGLNVLIMRSA